MYGLISEDYLMHHGVKGMKWGIRHDPQRTGRTAGSSKNSRSRNHFKLSKGTKVALAVTGIAAGTAVSLALIQRGKVHADDIMRAGTKIQTLHHHPELITEGKKFFTTNKSIDKIKYMAQFSHNGSKKKVTATVSENIKIAGGDSGDKIYKSLRQTNPEFRKATEQYKNYVHFNRRNLLGEPDKATNIFIDELKKKGYGGVADLNDRRGWKTSANILFDNSKLKNINVDNIKKSEYRRAQAINTARVVAEQYVNTPYATVVAAGGASASAAGIMEDKEINDRMNKKKKR